MYVAERRHPDQFSKRVEIFHRCRVKHFFIADKICLLAVAAGDIETIVEPGLLILVNNFATNFAERPGNVASRVRRLERPASLLPQAKFGRVGAPGLHCSGRVVLRKGLGRKHAHHCIIAVGYYQVPVGIEGEARNAVEGG